MNIPKRNRNAHTLVATLPLFWMSEEEHASNPGKIAPTQEDVIRMIARALRIGKSAPDGLDDVFKRIAEEKRISETEVRVPDDLKVGIRFDFFDGSDTPRQLYDGVDVEESLRLTMDNIFPHADSVICDESFVIFISGDSEEQLEQYRDLLTETDYGYDADNPYWRRGWHVLEICNVDFARAMRDYPI